MKSERRHELETNSLALWLRWRAPQLWEQYGTKILIGLIAIVLLVVVVRWRINAPREAAQRAAVALAQAEEAVEQLQAMRITPGEASQASAFVQQALAESDRADVQARAYALLGDYYWALATYMGPPATQPTERPEVTGEQALVRAQDAYQKVVAIEGASPLEVTNARIGLGVIAATLAAEEEAKAGAAKAGASPLWDEARKQFQAVVDHPAIPESQKQLAVAHLERIEEMQEPVWIVEAPEQPLDLFPPTTAPAGPLGPAFPSLEPAVPSAEPTTQPAQ